MLKRSFVFMSFLLSAHTLDGHIAVGKVDRLRTGVLHRHRQAAPLGNVHVGGDKDIEIVLHGGRRNRSHCTCQRLSVDCQSSSDRAQRAAGRDGDVSAKGHAESRLTLIRKTAKRHLPAAFAVYDTGLACNGGFRKRDILPDRDRNDVGIHVFSQNNHSFQNTAAELLPRRVGVSISTGLNSSGFPNSW
nr:MAG TPA: hypothetical protein [Caudoviricetes sp.]